MDQWKVIGIQCALWIEVSSFLKHIIQMKI